MLLRADRCLPTTVSFPFLAKLRRAEGPAGVVQAAAVRPPFRRSASRSTSRNGPTCSRRSASTARPARLRAGSRRRAGGCSSATISRPNASVWRSTALASTFRPPSSCSRAAALGESHLARRAADHSQHRGRQAAVAEAEVPVARREAVAAGVAVVPGARELHLAERGDEGLWPATGVAWRQYDFSS